MKRAKTDREAAWLADLATLLLEEEAATAQALEPFVQQAVDDIEAIIEELPPSSPSRELAWTAAQPALDKVLSDLNR
jgi:hypothetical protein